MALTREQVNKIREQSGIQMDSISAESKIGELDGKLLTRQRSAALKSTAGIPKEEQSGVFDQSTVSQLGQEGRTNVGLDKEDKSFGQSILDFLNPFSEENKAKSAAFKSFIEKGAAGELDTITEEERQAAENVALDIGFATETPRIVSSIKKTATPLSKKILNKVKSIFGKGSKEVVEEVGEKVGKEVAEDVAKNLSKTQQKIYNNIQPKLTAKQKSILVKDQRIIKGKKSRTGGVKPDTIIPSSREIEAINTIEARIPKASKMDEFTLANNIADEIGNISTDLGKKLSNIGVNADDVSKLTNNWEALKASQNSSLQFRTRPKPGKATQEFFETFLSDAKEAKSLEDLWKIAIEYDSQITPSIKRATSNSAITTQLQKEAWLENRRVLRDIIEESSARGGAEAQQAFRELSSLYDSFDNIANGGTASIKGKESALKKALKSNIVKWGGALIGVKLLTD